jgi:hypothetical protein
MTHTQRTHESNVRENQNDVKPSAFAINGRTAAGLFALSRRENRIRVFDLPVK